MAVLPSLVVLTIVADTANEARASIDSSTNGNLSLVGTICTVVTVLNSKHSTYIERSANCSLNSDITLVDSISKLILRTVLTSTDMERSGTASHIHIDVAALVVVNTLVVRAIDLASNTGNMHSGFLFACNIDLTVVVAVEDIALTIVVSITYNTTNI